MLSLQLKSGEYLSIGDDIAVQIFEQSGSTFRVSVKAPREIPILRGEVLERTEQRPDGLLAKRPKSPSERARDAARVKQFEEKRARAEAERKQAAALQSAVTRELLDILGEVSDLANDPDALRSSLAALCGRLNAVHAVLNAEK